MSQEYDKARFRGRFVDRSRAVGKTTHAWHFESAQAFGRAILDAHVPQYTGGGNAWQGGLSLTRAVEQIHKGDMRAVKAAQKLFDRVDAEIPAVGKRYRYDVAGAYPIVPRAVGSIDPRNMRRRMRTVAESTPLRVYVGATVSAGFDSHALALRGRYVLALAMKLTQMRPVELYLYIGMGTTDYGKFSIMPIPTTPLDTAAASFALTHPSFLRVVGFTFNYRWPGFGRESGGNWPWGTYFGVDRELRLALGAEQDGETLIIDGCHIDDWTDGQAGAEQWLRKQLKRFAPLDDGAR